MSVIASVLDADGTAWVADVLTRLPDGLGTEGDGESGVHISYHVADDYAAALTELGTSITRIERDFCCGPDKTLRSTDDR